MSDKNSVSILFSDVLRYAVVALILFGIMELLKPGIIMHYFNLAYYAVFVVILGVISLFIKR